MRNRKKEIETKNKEEEEILDAKRKAEQKAEKDKVDEKSLRQIKSKKIN